MDAVWIALVFILFAAVAGLTAYCARLRSTS